MDALLDVQGLKTHFGSGEHAVRAVDGVDLAVQAGEAMGLVGESGCGKSMFARSLMRLLPPNGRVVAGQARFRGEDLLAKSEAEMCALRGSEIALVLQNPLTSLNPTLRVGVQIGEPLVAHGVARSHRGARGRVLELMRAMHLPSPEEHYRQYPHELSGGMRQRAVIAAALACRPSLLICDEPTTALDVAVQAGILELLREIKDRHGAAILLISHDVAVVNHLCERLAVMYAGRLVETGPTRDVLAAPKHPYTQGLLQCVPRLRTRREMVPISGEVPDPAALPTGCKFHPRCPLVEPRCLDSEPPLAPVGEGRLARCILYEQGRSL